MKKVTTPIFILFAFVENLFAQTDTIQKTQKIINEISETTKKILH